MTSERGECLSLTDMKGNGIIYLWCRNSKCMGTRRQVKMRSGFSNIMHVCLQPVAG